jgi:hypothetical protein
MSDPDEAAAGSAGLVHPLSGGATSARVTSRICGSANHRVEIAHGASKMEAAASKMEAAMHA